MRTNESSSTSSIQIEFSSFFIWFDLYSECNQCIERWSRSTDSQTILLPIATTEKSLSDVTWNWMCCSIYLVCNSFQIDLSDRFVSLFFREDAFQKEDVSFSDARYEEACILYNIGALYTKLGVNEPRRTPDVGQTNKINTYFLNKKKLF